MSEALQPLIVDVVIPAQNSAATIGEVLGELPSQLFRSVVVVDRGSVDSTAQLARDAGAVVIREPGRGFGAACSRAVAHLASLPRRPDVVVFVSADGSDDPEDLASLLAPIRSDNAELVIGVRQTLNRRGRRRRPRGETRLALGLIGIIYRHRFEDVGPFRAIRFPALVALGLNDRGSAWNIEMQVKSLKLGLRIAEVPVIHRNLAAKGDHASLRRQAASAGRVLFQIFRHSTAK